MACILLTAYIILAVLPHVPSRRSQLSWMCLATVTEHYTNSDERVKQELARNLSITPQQAAQFFDNLRTLLADAQPAGPQRPPQ